MKNNTLLQTLRKQMSNQIHYDYRPHVSPMTTEGMKSMSPSKQMTRNQINTNTIKPKRKATGIASLGPATRLNMSVGDCNHSSHAIRFSKDTRKGISPFRSPIC